MWLLYLCIPVSASTAEIRALSSAGGCHDPQGHGIIALINTGIQEEFMLIHMRLAQPQEAQTAFCFIDEAREHQREQGFVQWADDYPNLNTVLTDIQNGNGYLLTDSQLPFGYVCIDFGGEAAYDAIEGNWKTCRKYAVIHRMAFGKPKRGMGISKEVFSLARKLCLARDIHAIRIDTGLQNQKMQHILQREGFQYCGTVYYSGSPRMAYELDF